MNFTPIELSAKDKIEKYLQAQVTQSSELTFLSLYIWRKAFNIQFAEHSGCVVLMFRDNDYPPSLRYPLGGGDKKSAIDAAVQSFVDKGFQPRFYGLTKDMKDELETLYPNKYTITPMRDYFDYVYSVSQLISLSGKDLHSKRNHVNSFMRTYDYLYKPLSKDDAQEIKETYDSWFFSSKKKPDYYLFSERQSIIDILENFDELGCKGAKLYANGKLCAFSIGERLNENTAVIHVEKADKNIKGAYATINQMFLENEWSNFEYINREDDFGIAALRRAKKSYRPAFMVEKYSAISNEQS
ncbi:MAG: phosphatidylglycerol lysyltransferase domain-containing protein [Firmicutes bacterium]|nr:phosphatidylglycerol lysyltransferase domain-containing protein [Bacillota bacterium]